MGFWSRTPAFSDKPVAILKERYLELGSLQAVADAERVDIAWLGRQLRAYDRRVAGSGAAYTGPERRRRD